LLGVNHANATEYNHNMMQPWTIEPFGAVVMTTPTQELM